MKYTFTNSLSIDRSFTRHSLHYPLQISHWPHLLIFSKPCNVLIFSNSLITVQSTTSAYQAALWFYTIESIMDIKHILPKNGFKTWIERIQIVPTQGFINFFPISWSFFLQQKLALKEMTQQFSSLSGRGWCPSEKIKISTFSPWFHFLQT